MDALFEKVLERLGSKRAILGLIVIWLMDKFAERDPENAQTYAILMVVVAGIFVAEEFLEKVKLCNGRESGSGIYEPSEPVSGGEEAVPGD